MALMNAGLSAFRKLQLFKETAPFTAGRPATALLRGLGTIKNLVEVKVVDEDIGYAFPVDRTYIAKKLAQLSLQPVVATFEQIGYLFEAGIKLVGTGVADGAGSGKIYAYAFPNTSKNAPQTYTLQGGDDQQTEFVPGCFVEKIKLSGKKGEAWTMSGDWTGQFVAPNNLTASTISFDNLHHILDSANGLAIFPAGAKVVVTGTVNNNGTFTVTVSAAGQLTVAETTATEAAGSSFTLTEIFSVVAVPSVEDMLFGNTRLYIDAVGGTLGGTLKSTTMLGADVEIVTGLSPVFTDGQVYYQDISLDKKKMAVNLKLTFRHNGIATVEKAYWLSQTPRKLRLSVQGTAFGTPGTTYTHKTFNLDLAGKWITFSELGEQEGENVVTGDFRGFYNATAAIAPTVTVVNELASLP